MGNAQKPAEYQTTNVTKTGSLRRSLKSKEVFESRIFQEIHIEYYDILITYGGTEGVQ